ncbi:MAG: hypothetical protein COV44_09655 [Deltaproteobacteria bacterium CG11_big_fil_rev_8_21_14_0_20_45_16]|nr:MAG: hypothetical protein COV44_09655 [Deltaproteobacteria bacterium CG11_big_fil_rev_8_21_14_0_20_45_16]
MDISIRIFTFIVMILSFSSVSFGQVLYTKKKLEPCGQSGSTEVRMYDCHLQYFDSVHVIESKGKKYAWQLLSMDESGRQIWVDLVSGLAVTSHNGDGMDRENYAGDYGGNAVFYPDAVEACNDSSKYTELKQSNELDFRLPTKEDAEVIIKGKAKDVFFATSSNGLFRHTVRGGKDDESTSIFSFPTWTYFTLWTSTVAPQSNSDKKKNIRRAYTFDASGTAVVGPIDYHEGMYGTFIRRVVNYQAYRLFLCVANVPKDEMPTVDFPDSK